MKPHFSNTSNPVDFPRSNKSTRTRILELAAQCGLGRDRWNTTEQFELFLENYTDLIVRECSRTIQDFVDHRIPASEYPKKLIETFGKENNEQSTY